MRGGADEPASGLISFKIDNVSYQAEAGMTWFGWMSSSYNTGGFVQGGTVQVPRVQDAAGNTVKESTGAIVHPGAAIVENGVYYAAQ